MDAGERSLRLAGAEPHVLPASGTPGLVLGKLSPGHQWPLASVGTAVIPLPPLTPQPELPAAHACRSPPLPGIVPTQEEVLSGLRQETSFPWRVPAPQDLSSWPQPSHDSSSGLKRTWPPQRVSRRGQLAPAPQRCPFPPGTPFSPGLGQLHSLVPLVSWGLTALSLGVGWSLEGRVFHAGGPPT